MKTFSQHLKLSPPDLEVLLSLSFKDFLNSPQQKELLGSLDAQLLKQTLSTAKSVLAER